METEAIPGQAPDASLNTPVIAPEDRVPRTQKIAYGLGTIRHELEERRGKV